MSVGTEFTETDPVLLRVKSAQPSIAFTAARTLLIAVLLGVVLAVIEPIHPHEWLRVAWQIAIGAVECIVVLAFCRNEARLELSSRLMLGAAFVVAVLLSFLSTESAPWATDEYGYTFLANTLLHGRLWNAPPPQIEVFHFAYLWLKDGKYFSQYAPGWPAFEAPFIAAGLQNFANPLLTVVMGWAMVRTMRLLGHADRPAAALAALFILSPFVLLLGSSLLNHMLTGAAISVLCWRQLEDERVPRRVNRLVIGLCLSVLLATRYEVFAVVLAIYVADRLWYRRFAFIADCVPIALGALPVTALLLAYNWAITGSPFHLTQSWANPNFKLGLHGTSLEGRSNPLQSVRHELLWFGLLLEYGGAATVLAYGAALLARLRARRVRFWDLMLPAAMVFFFFFPDSGGYPTYGPRYWFVAWPCMALTIGAAVTGDTLHLPLLRRRVSLQSFALYQTAVSVGVLLIAALFFRGFAQSAVEVLDIPPLSAPSIVLVPSRGLVLGPWQDLPLPSLAEGEVRNGTDFDKQVLFGIDTLGAAGNQARYEALACTVPGRAVYRWMAPGRVEPIDCTAIKTIPPLQTQAED